MLESNSVACFKIITLWKVKLTGDISPGAVTEEGLGLQVKTVTADST